MIFKPNELFSKHGFWDGELISYYFETKDGSYIPCNSELLYECVETFVLPKLNRKIELLWANPFHNPVRVKSVDGIDIDIFTKEELSKAKEHSWMFQLGLLTPDEIEIDDKIIEEFCLSRNIDRQRPEDGEHQTSIFSLELWTKDDWSVCEKIEFFSTLQAREKYKNWNIQYKAIEKEYRVFKSLIKNNTIPVYLVNIVEGMGGWTYFEKPIFGQFRQDEDCGKFLHLAGEQRRLHITYERKSIYGD